MLDMMLRSKRVLGNTGISTVAVKRKMTRNRTIIRRSLSEGHIERKSTRKRSSSVLHCGTGLCQVLGNCDCTSGVKQSSVAEHSSIRKAKKGPSTEVEKCCAVSPSSTTSWQVQPISNQMTDVQSSSVSNDTVRSHEMEDSVTEVIPIETSDVSVLEIAHKPTSDAKRSTDADTSDIIIIPDSPGQRNAGIIIIIPDSPGQRNAGNKNLKNTSFEVLQVQGRKRKNSDESGVEILCDISGSRPKKQQKMECDFKEKRLWTNTTVKENYTVTVTDTDRKVSQLTKNVKSADVINITGERSSGDVDDVIFISVEDEEVSVINTKNEHKPPQEDVIILDSPPAQTPVQSSGKKPKKMVSASTSITGLIPHYTKHLLDYISLDGKPPATSSGLSTGTPRLPAAGRGRKVMHKHRPVLNKSWSPNTIRQQRNRRAASQHRLLNACSRDPAVQTNSVPVSTCPPTSHGLTATETSTIRNPTQNSTVQNSTTQNLASENSVQSAPSVPQSPACAYGTNIYNPNASEKEEDGLRPIIIDGNNIAMGHGKGKCFSWRGLHICIKYFLKRGHKVTAFVPTFRRGVCPPKLRPEMETYERSGQVVFTPSRRIEGRLIVPYDDRFIVQCAAELGGVIVSTDNFRDLLTENNNWKETIEKRLLMFTWVGDLLMFPHDPLGRYGPRLEDFLRFPKKL